MVLASQSISRSCQNISKITKLKGGTIMAKGMNVLLAAAAGFAAGVLLAPKSGAETREDLKHKADEAKRMAGEKAEHVKGAVKDGVDSVRNHAKNAGDEMSGMAESAKESARLISTEAKDLGREAKHRGGRVAGQAHEAADDTDDTLRAM
jgi:gas vesicle protein